MHLLLTAHNKYRLARLRARQIRVRRECKAAMLINKSQAKLLKPQSNRVHGAQTGQEKVQTYAGQQ